MTRNITETKCFTLVGGVAPERMLPQVSRAMVRTATRQILTTFRHETTDSGRVWTPTAPEPARSFSNRSGVGHSIPPASTSYSSRHPVPGERVCVARLILAGVAQPG